jgi:penicillin-binding protein 4B
MPEQEGLKKNRIFIILVVLVAVLIVWNLRLFWIQIAASRSFSDRDIDLVHNSVIQREEGIVLHTGRGDFYDRLGRSLTGQDLSVLTIFPIHKEERSATERVSAIRQVGTWLKVPAAQWNQYLEKVTAPTIWAMEGRPVPLTTAQADGISALGLPHIRVMPYRQRYAAQQTAAQVIGYISQNPERLSELYTAQVHSGELQLHSKIGNAGLEKTFEPWLQGIGMTSVSLFTDSEKHPVNGLNVRIQQPENRYYPLKIMTTLDASLQGKVEQLMQRRKIQEGAVVVLDMATADTVVMASTPAFHPEHIDLGTEEWSNRALKAVTPGSIFKTVTAAAALEEEAVHEHETFDCQGALGRFGFTCWKKEGHGRLTLEEGFAQSCNIVFAKVAERLGAAKLEEYARRLGVVQQVGWQGDLAQVGAFRQWDAEDRGQVYAKSTNQADPGALAQTSIGQRDVQMTPLQAANLVVTLLHHGEVLSPRIVSEIRFQNDRLYEEFPVHPLDTDEKRISAATAKRLLQYMGGVVDHGTGSYLRNAKWDVAGKSGTAQITLPNRKPGVNQWFIGYGPVEKPRYAVSVVVHHQAEEETNKSIPLFQEVMDLLAAQ